MLKYKIPQIVTLTRINTPNFLMKKYAYFCYAAKTKNPRKVLIYRDFLCFIILSSGETGIRTPGTSQYNGFQDRRNRPLCHLSKTPFQKYFPLKALQRYNFILNKQIVYQFFCYKIFKSYFCIRIINERNKS